MDKADLTVNEVEGSSMLPQPKYNVEFFHIYTDERIEARHQEGLESLRAMQQSWSFGYDKIVLIDNYNPKVHITSAPEVLSYLGSQDMLPDFWAYEGDMVDNAKALLATIPESKLKRNYQKYIESHGKYPCSLLTASWYLTRLGRFDMSAIKSTNPLTSYAVAHRLFNLLPEDYKPVEDRARQIILASPFAADADRIQDFFYPTSSGRSLDLF